MTKIKRNNKKQKFPLAIFSLLCYNDILEEIGGDLLKIALNIF